MIKNKVQKFVKKFGYQLQSLIGVSSLAGSFQQLKNLGINPNWIIDCGASDGRWTKVAQPYFPNAGFIMVEPLEEHWPKLVNMKGTRVVQGAVDTEGGEQTLYVQGSYSSLRPADQTEKRTIKTVSLNSLIATPKTLLKLDVDGQEMKLLTASDLSNVIAIVIEIAPGTLLDIVTLLDKRGFVLSNVFNLNYDQKGKLQQFDALFIRK